MSDVYIKIKMDEKEVKLKSSTLNNSNLAMIFRLDLNQGIYISSKEGEIILPSDTGEVKKGCLFFFFLSVKYK